MCPMLHKIENLRLLSWIKQSKKNSVDIIYKLNPTYMQWFNWIQIVCNLAEFLGWHIKHVSSL